MRFIFYDTETTGTDRSFDQILQFAAILANGELRELDSFSLRCRLLPHILPAPEALAVTGLGIGRIVRHPTSHLAMMRMVRARLRDWSAGGAVFAGWNSLRFDEAVLRQAFYQTLQPPYLTSSGGNGRLDVMKLAHAVTRVAPNAMIVPRDADGKTTYRLERFAEANGVRLSHAHDALADARAALDLARIISVRAPRIFAEMLANASRDALRRRLAAAPAHAFVESVFGRPEIMPVAVAAANPEDANELALADLSRPPEEYLAAGDGAIADLFENRGPGRVLHRIRVNAAPSLLPVDLLDRRSEEAGITRAELLRRAEALAAAEDFRARLAAFLSRRARERPLSPHLEERIYERFPCASDEKLMAAFHEARWEDRPALIRRFEDDRLRSLGLRLLACERPDLLSEAERERWREFLRGRLFPPGPVPWTSAPAAWASPALRAMPDYVEHLRRLARELGAELPELA
ncbi:MAG: hypothetical protein KIT20_08995 [Alphaproteobacteria bacterium]|nr:hypothetical protein [Alphaproteobacteria bacterium]